MAKKRNPTSKESINARGANMVALALLAAASFFAVRGGGMVTFLETHDQATYPSVFMTLTDAIYPSELYWLPEFNAASAHTLTYLAPFPEMNDLAVTATSAAAAGRRLRVGEARRRRHPRLIAHPEPLERTANERREPPRPPPQAVSHAALTHPKGSKCKKKKPQAFF
jgi:hypothetical protein